MKKIITIAVCLFIGFQLSAQNVYWVFFKDKHNTEFNPKVYFDSKALQRYENMHQSANDISNYPVSTYYKTGVLTLAEKYIGQSRWLNAIAVEATPAEIDIIKELPYVTDIKEIHSEALTAGKSAPSTAENIKQYDATLQQISLMQGEKFQESGYNGKGVRVAILDGGFPEVNTHPAFKHLRENNQIIKTWNFVQNKENVYTGSFHGRMVLSCIGGIMNDTTLLGMAPGADFLLARTEVDVEKKKEEVWWVEALEWADQNGADIVNSSLGYSDCRYTLNDMNGETSIVAKAANTAARKGILVCTAMGNEGSNSWHVLVTPADADSVLSVGAVESLEHRSFYSSYGPTADGRRKPNVVACGHDMVAERKGNYNYSQGTSFATPLVAGFAACVKQMNPSWTAWQLKEEIEKSGNHYPYFDYALGYGVPQASYFTGKQTKTADSFTLAEDSNYIYITPINPSTKHKLFYNITNGDGSIELYKDHLLNLNDNAQEGNTALIYSIDKKDLLNGQILKLWYNNQYAEYVVGKDVLPIASNDIKANDKQVNEELPMTSNTDFYLKSSSNKYVSHLSMTTGFYIPSMWSENVNIHQTERISRSLSVVWDNAWKLGRVYRLGFRLGFGSSWYAVDSAYTAKQMCNMGSSLQEMAEIRKSNIKTTQFDLELFQRFKLSSGAEDKSWFLDTGIYGEWITGSHYKAKIKNPATENATENPLVSVQRHFLKGKINPLDYGVRLRVGYGHFAIFGQYRISNIMKEGNDLPRIQVGIQLF